MNLILRLFTGFCIATCLTIGILTAVFAARGNLDGPTLTKILALINGIDISGQRLAQVLAEDAGREQPDFEDVLAARQQSRLEADLRTRSQAAMRAELTAMLADLQQQRERFEERRVAFEQKLAETRGQATSEGLAEVQRTLQAIEADQAKNQLTRMLRDDRMDDVVNIIQAMPLDKRKEILAEFQSEAEADDLYEILRRIGEGSPVTDLIDAADPP